MRSSVLISSLWLVSGGSTTANLLQALEEYLPVLLGLVKESKLSYPLLVLVIGMVVFGNDLSCMMLQAVS